MFATRSHIGSSSGGWITPILLTELKDEDAGDGVYVAGVSFNSVGFQTNGNQSVPAPSAGRSPYYIPTGENPAVWVRCDLISGTAPDNATGTWTGQAFNPSWSWERVSSGTTSAVARFRVATDSGGSTVVLDTGNINVTVTVP